MCIICNCGDKGHEFLCAFSQSRAAMKKAAEMMLACSRSLADERHLSDTTRLTSVWCV